MGSQFMHEARGWAAIGAIALGGGCYEGPPAQDQGSGTDGASSGTPDSDGETTAGVPSACDDSPGRVGLQRLTRAEYNRTVRDLFGITSNPADVFPPDSVSGGFDNHAKSLTISPQLASLLFDTAQTVAAEAMANGADTIITCDPATDAECDRTSIEALALRVYRRPPSTAEVDDLLALVRFAQDEGDTFEAGIEYALQAMLVAPQFLYRSVPATGDAPPVDGEIVVLDDYAVASRLSYFLWGSTPDDELLARAGEGSLSDLDGLREEFDRMLTDDKAAALHDGFLSQWLQFGKLGASTPDPVAFPEFTDALRDQMLAESRMFFAGILERDGSALEIIAGTQTYANADLAAIYGVPGVTGSALVPIQTDPAQRAGVLTMPAVLTMTSDPTQPNIVRRGVWLAETILCAEPPPPPDGVPPAPDPQPGETERERLARHREDPSCASCHNLIDPLGFPFENYDAMGAWRDDIDGEPVDNVGTLPDGTQFSGVVELAGLLSTGEDYPVCISEKLMTYALGRTMGVDDECRLEEIGLANVTPDTTLSDLLWGIVSSRAFLTEEIGAKP